VSIGAVGGSLAHRSFIAIYGLRFGRSRLIYISGEVKSKQITAANLSNLSGNASADCSWLAFQLNVCAYCPTVTPSSLFT